MDASTGTTDFITQVVTSFKALISAAQSSPNPEVYYIAAAVAVIFFLYIIEKMFKIATLLFFIGVIACGVGASQSNSLQGIVATIQASLGKMIAGFSTATSGSSNSSNSSGSSGSSGSSTSATVVPNSAAVSGSANGSYITGNAPSTSAGASSGSSSSTSGFSSILSTLSGGK